MIIKSFRWYGGKIRLVHILNFLIPEHAAYFEPFMGSAALLLNHPRSELEVVNDLDSDIAFFMKTLADSEKGEELVKRLYHLQYGRPVFDAAVEASRDNFTGLDEIEKAAMIYVLVSQSFNGTRKSFSEGSFKDTYAYQSDIRFHIPKVHERLQDVHVLNMDGADLLDGITDNPDAFTFVDPPYRPALRGRGADRAYGCEMQFQEQTRLLETIKGARCKIMLCGYKAENNVDLYDVLLKPYGWKCYKLADISKACQVKKKNRDMGHEYIWVNYELPYAARYVISMKEY